jgi:hypothetical protein
MTAIEAELKGLKKDGNSNGSTHKETMIVHIYTSQ